MKLATNFSYLLFFFLIATLLTDPAASQSTGSVDGPAPFDLINIDDLLKSLNQTYASLTKNLANINSSVQNSPSNLNNQPKPATKNDSPSQANPSKKNQPLTNSKDSKQLVDKTSSQQPAKTIPPITKQPIKNTNISIIKDTNPVKSSSNQDSSSNKGAVQQPKTTVTVKNSSNSQSTSITKNSTLPTFGPGPIDKSLPPVIDLTKMTTIYSYSQNKTTNSSNSVNNLTLSSNAKTKTNSSYTSTSSASTEDSPLQQLKKLQEKQLQQIKKLQQQQKKLDKTQSTAQSQSIAQPQTTPQKKSEEKTSTQTQVKNQQSTQTKPELKPILSLPQQSKSVVPIVSGTKFNPSNNLQSQSNQIYLSTINGNTNSNKKDDHLAKTVTNQSIISSSYSEKNQLNKKISYYATSKGALYNITPSYNAFKKYFVLSDRDQYLPTIQTFLITNYGNYLAGQQLIAGFRVYNEDNSLDYQILYSTTFGTFTSILTFYTDTATIQLKSLSILNFYIMDIDYSNCQEKDLDKKNCKICSQGYRNFMGRCQLFDSSCLSYTTDECAKCSSQKKLIKGLCK